MKKGLVIFTLLLAALCVGAFLFFDILLKPIKPNNINETETLAKNEFKLDQINCEETDKTRTCTKTLEVEYLEEKHIIKIQMIKDGNDTKINNYTFDLYIDNNKIKSFDAGNTSNDVIKNGFDGRIFIFSNEYLGVLREKVSENNTGYYLTLINRNEIVKEDIEVIPLEYKLTCDTNEEVCNENLKDKYDFDGINLRFWLPTCDTVKENSVTVSKIKLSFSGHEELLIKEEKTKDKVTKTGANKGMCFNKKDIINIK